MATTKNNDIQCLRAVAILMVLLQHYRSRLPTPDAYYRVFDHFVYSHRGPARFPAFPCPDGLRYPLF